ncbi:NPCBM/NEW2 domain-containing protein [Prauserella aidingensis]|uniref:NPCBM/NEW2 domain-containing protein n=1 Tax=Prauserella aidingensis TaxID=387890 RepID=UPI0020A27DF5|nr:NPCBM/NEW2 domain-containing protein [Prauserella aidingensis]MCP2253913.1 NPCBM/NEW2 domain-containing protein [Prauserella aidingensis]
MRERPISASVGLDDETDEPGAVSFEVLADGRSRSESGVVTGADPAVPVSADVTGARMVTLRVTDGGDGKNSDPADWADATVHCRG